MKTNETNNDFRPQRTTMMLPHRWKAVGFIVAAIAFAAAFIMSGLHVDAFWRECCVSVVVLGLFVAAMSKDRHEDEMLRSIRLAAIFLAFCWIVLYVMIYPLIARFTHTEMVRATIAVFAMLAVYHMSFMWMKWRVRREKHD